MSLTVEGVGARVSSSVGSWGFAVLGEGGERQRETPLVDCFDLAGGDGFRVLSRYA